MSQTIEFTLDGRAATLIVPERPAPGNPWVWRTEFLYAFNQADLALLARGFHIAYYCVSNEYGSPAAIAAFHRFHDYLTETYRLSPRAALFGFSRGGLYACNYAIAYPADCTCLYLDAPVLDLKSWPAGLGLGCGSPAEWEDCKARVFSLRTVADVLAFRGAPIDRLPELIATRLPVLLVAGGADKTVPYEENGACLVAAYRAAGAPVTVIVKPECDHHPHSLADPAPIVAFVEAATFGKKENIGQKI